MELSLAISPGELTRSEQKILNYINTNPDSFLLASIGQLSQHLGISDATVSRFARHAGCADFKGLKTMVVEQAAGPAAKIAGTLSQDGGFSPAAWLERQQHYLRKTIQQLDDATFRKATEALLQANRIFLHGKNASYPLAQMLALIPGVSRSGITMTAARFLGIGREEAARFSMLLAVPTIGAAGAWTALKVFTAPVGESVGVLSLLTGVSVSFAGGALAISFLMNWLKKSSFAIFALYRVLLGLALFFIF